MLKGRPRCSPESSPSQSQLVDRLLQHEQLEQQEQPAAGQPGDPPGFVGAPAGGTPRGAERRKQLVPLERPSGLSADDFVASRPGQVVAPKRAQASASSAPPPAPARPSRGREPPRPAASFAGWDEQLPAGSLAPAAADSSRAAEVPEFCPGCGIRMQDQDAHAPGFFKRPEVRTPRISGRLQALTEEEAFPGGVVPENFVGELPERFRKSGGKSSEAPAEAAPPAVTDAGSEGAADGADAEYAAALKRFEDSLFAEDSEASDARRKPARRPKLGPAGDPRASPAQLLTVCARCHSLRHYGRVKHEDAEALMPAFDFAAAVAQRMKGEYAFRATVLVLVDLADFDGSFPRSAATLISPSEEARPSALGRLHPLPFFTHTHGIGP